CVTVRAATEIYTLSLHDALPISDERYGTSIRVKVNVAEVLRAELARPSWRRDGIVIGAATDPYQPAEGRYRLTRSCLETLHDARSEEHTAELQSRFDVVCRLLP